MPEEKPWYVQQSPDIGSAFAAFYQAANESGILDNKTKELLMAALACAFRCPHCTEEHVQGALKAGASKEEVAEALLIAAVEGAGTQLYWCKDVYERHLGAGD
jgi:AhpD family alkylhydroperoxidase